MSGAEMASDPVESPESTGGDGPYAILRNRDFLLYLISRFISSFGQQMLGVTVGWEIYERTNSTLNLGCVGLVQMIPMFIFVFPAGHVADNYNRKNVMLWMQVVLAVASVGMAAVSALNASVVWMYGCLFLFSTARTYIWPSSASFLPQLVPRTQFARAVTWNSGCFQISAVLGPVAGGALIALTRSPALVYALNGVSCVFCFALLLMVRTHHKVIVRERMSIESIVTGLRFVWRTKIVFGSLTLDLFAVVFGGATAMLPVFCKDILHVGPDGLGWLQSALPLGSLLMSLILLHRRPLQKAGRTLLWSVAGFGLATIGFGLSPWFWLSFAMLFLCGMTDYISVVVRHTLVQLLTPDEMRGRVSAINSLFIGTSNQLGEFESGFVAYYTTQVFSVVSGGVGTLVVVVLVAWLWPEIRKYGRLDA